MSALSCLMSARPIMTTAAIAAWDDRQVSSAKPIHVQLNADEREALPARLLDWGGPPRPTDVFATAMGFTDAASMSSEARKLWQPIERSSSLAAEDWRRVLLAVEIVSLVSRFQPDLAGQAGSVGVADR